MLNFGLPNSGTDQQYLTWREFATGIEHDLLLLCPMAENIRRNVHTHRPAYSAFDGRVVFRAKPYFVFENGELILRHVPVPKDAMDEQPVANRTGEHIGSLRRFLRNLTSTLDQKVRGFRCLTQRLRRLALPEEYNSPQHPAWLLFQEILSRWARESRAPVVFCPIPTFDHIQGCIRFDPIASASRSLDRSLA